MRSFFLLPIIALAGISDYHTINFSPAFQNDTTRITHILDGNVAEWSAEKFTTDEKTKIRYAVDNNDQMLFLTIVIPDKTLQQSVTQQGMQLFIDAKGKKKEDRGVEFPLVMKNGQSADHMKIFGFSSIEPFSQNINTDGTINIAMASDSADILSIEYNIPLKMLEGSMNNLNNKKISIGWKLRGDESIPGNTTAQPAKITTSLVGKPNNGGIPITRNVPSQNVSQNNVKAAQVTKAQLFWTSYTISL